MANGFVLSTGEKAYAKSVMAILIKAIVLSMH